MSACNRHETRPARLVQAGVTGELYISGIMLARGYKGQPAMTADRFLPNPFGRGEQQHARMYKTGDEAFWRSDGVVVFLGRVQKDQQVSCIAPPLPPLPTVPGIHMLHALTRMHQAEFSPAQRCAVDVTAHGSISRHILYVAPQHSTAQHSTAQHSTAQCSMLSSPLTPVAPSPARRAS